MIIELKGQKFEISYDKIDIVKSLIERVVMEYNEKNTDTIDSANFGLICDRLNVFDINDSTKVWSVGYYKELKCVKTLLKLFVNKLNDENKVIARRVIFLHRRSTLADLERKLKQGRTGFVYKNKRTLYVEIDINDPSNDTEINESDLLIEQQIFDNSTIYFFSSE
ncbi:MAG: hypothetical protein GY928_29445 [Colwellia sp.]|nr:hypothetical protein [Colwellia sp.]